MTIGQRQPEAATPGDDEVDRQGREIVGEARCGRRVLGAELTDEDPYP